MATQEDVRRITLSLPETRESDDRFAFEVQGKGKPKGFAWVWLERIHPKQARVPQPAVLAIRVANLDEKNALLGMNLDCLFTEPHYNGFPAVLIRLSDIDLALLEVLLIDAWRCQAPKALVRAYDQEHQPPATPKHPY